MPVASGSAHQQTGPVAGDAQPATSGDKLSRPSNWPWVLSVSTREQRSITGTGTLSVAALPSRPGASQGCASR